MAAGPHDRHEPVSTAIAVNLRLMRAVSAAGRRAARLLQDEGWNTLTSHVEVEEAVCRDAISETHEAA
jgi:hypothetical protein